MAPHIGYELALAKGGKPDKMKKKRNTP